MSRIRGPSGLSSAQVTVTAASEEVGLAPVEPTVGWWVRRLVAV